MQAYRKASSYYQVHGYKINTLYKLWQIPAFVASLFWCLFDKPFIGDC